MKRIELDAYFILIARATSYRSTCPRASVGACIVQNGHLVSVGYNGAPSRVDHCCDVGCSMENGRCKRAVHAEANALLQARSTSIVGATLYCTHRPCLECSKLIINAGIKRIVFEHDYDSGPLTSEFLKQAGIEISKLEVSDEFIEKISQSRI